MPATAAPCQTTVLDLALDHVPVMAGRIDAQHRLCFANPPLTTALGSSLDKLLGSRLEQTCLAGLGELFARHCQLLSPGEVQVCQLSYQPPCLGQRSAEVTLASHHKQGDNPAGWLFFVQDTSESGNQASTVSRQQLELEQALTGAMQRGELLLHYQPLVDSEQRTLGMEALLRWQHPQHGLISPAEFLPLAERNGMIIGIGQWVLETACAQLAAWQQDAQRRHWTLNVNISARQINEPGFFEQLDATVSHAGIDPRGLQLELTETMPLKGLKRSLQHQLQQLVHKGMVLVLVLDDYGAGYTSLAYLKHLPLSWLKIDQSFIHGVANDERDQKIVCAILSLAASLELKVVAEGVETREQFDYLRNAGCHAFQGYLFGRPLPAEQLNAHAPSAVAPAPARTGS